jgi:ADP-dependent NAD(P)H-hydrate dehydratase / NAD(P)H-hydrate epimerase
MDLKDNNFLKKSLIINQNQMMEWEIRTFYDKEIDGILLMEKAAETAVLEIIKSFCKRSVIILCGPGNNGGDGFAIARKLKDLRWPVTICFDIRNSYLFSLECQINLNIWEGNNLYFDSCDLSEYSIIIDSIFGTGLNRYVSNYYLKLLKSISNSHSYTISIDIPSGINSNTGKVMGFAAKSFMTIVINSLKFANVVLPGKLFCGENKIINIGLSSSFNISKNIIYENIPNLWKNFIFLFSFKDHKYTRGNLFILGGSMPGAVKLSAHVSRRFGSGIVNIVPLNCYKDYYIDFPSGLIVRPYNNLQELNLLMDNLNADVLLIGPGLDVNDHTVDLVYACLKTLKPVVIDAGAISCFKSINDRNILFSKVHRNCVFLPHTGEFSILFPYEIFNTFLFIYKFTQLTSCTFLLKGGDTIIVSSNGDCSINSNAPYFLSTAGTGDVLSGIVSSLISQGVNNYLSCLISSWVHGEAANRFGLGLIAEDIELKISNLLKDLKFLDI